MNTEQKIDGIYLKEGARAIKEILYEFSKEIDTLKERIEKLENE